MRRYTITVNDVTRVIDVEELTADTYRVRVDGRFVDVRLDDHRGLAHAAIAPTIEVARAGAPVSPRGAVAPVTGAGPDAEAVPAAATGGLPSAPAATARPAATASGGGRTDRMTAPMPGVLLEIRVAPGSAVTRGQTVMVLEAMKMKNELKAPRDGTVAELFVTEGQLVKYGEALLRFEENR